MLALGMDARGAVTKVAGRVVGPDGTPVAGAEVGTIWGAADGQAQPYKAATTDADGHFEVLNDFYDRPGALLAVNPARDAGGLIVVDLKQVPTAVEIKLGPLVRFRGDLGCTDIGKHPRATAVLMTLGETPIRVGQCISQESRFDLRLPVGRYRLEAYGSESDQHIKRDLDLKAEAPDMDLGTLDLPASALGKMVGKEAIPLHVTDARGIGKDMKLADLKGKWVVLDFWGYWCGPCVGRGLPDLMQIWDEHPDDRDKFAILAFHDKQAETFEQLDKKLAPIVRDTWGGRELPFPILLDATGKTVEEYGIRSWPTSVLIDPEGKVVEGGEEVLRRVLPPIPITRQVPLALDRGLALTMDRIKLGQFTELLGRKSHVPLRLDEPALTSAGVDRETPIPLTIRGADLSLRSWLELGLQPLGLVAVPVPEGLIVATPRPDVPLRPEPSATQRRANERIGRKLTTPATFDLRAKSLTEVIGHFEERTGENFVLDPADRLAGRLDPKATVTGKADGVPLRDGLEGLLGPLGIEAVVRDEVVILTRPARP